MKDQQYAVRPNKTQIKREIRMFNDLGKELIAMPETALKKVPLSDAMVKAIADGKRFKRGALQRQLRRIASLMQYEEIDAIKLELARQKQPSKQQVEELHQLEEWRDRLINGDDKLLTELIDEFVNIDRQHINQLVRNAKLELKRSKPPKSARSLFKYLLEIKNNANAVDVDNEKGGPDQNSSTEFET